MALKGENVSFELVLARERWLTLMQNRKREKKKRERGRLEGRNEKGRCGIKIGKKEGEGGRQRQEKDG